MVKNEDIVKKICLLLFCFPLLLMGQGLFEESLSGESDNEKAPNAYEMNGFFRGVLYAGKISEASGNELKSGYGEIGLKLSAKMQDFGDGYAEVRFKKGSEFGMPISEMNLREAYVNAYFGNFDFRIGHQIVVWGRADGFNPTNNITPSNMLVRSPDEDDRREANFILRTFYNVGKFRVEGILIPTFAPSVLPIDVIPLPWNVPIGGPVYPDQNFKNGAYALKLHYEGQKLDGSISYFDGFNPFPGVNASITGLFPQAYRTNVLGTDFSTSLGPFGLRGEFAYSSPHDYEQHVFVPNPDFQYVTGLDREFGDFSIVLQYIGRHVKDFKKLDGPKSAFEIFSYELAQKNRMLSQQLFQTTHSISFRPALKLFYETMTVELLGLYNFTTEELLTRPKITYSIADALKLSMGAEIYTGPEETLFGAVEETLSAVFLELRASF
jgi:hypothetical protein